MWLIYSHQLLATSPSHSQLCAAWDDLFSSEYWSEGPLWRIWGRVFYGDAGFGRMLIPQELENATRRIKKFKRIFDVNVHPLCESVKISGWGTQSESWELTKFPTFLSFLPADFSKRTAWAFVAAVWGERKTQRGCEQELAEYGWVLFAVMRSNP